MASCTLRPLRAHRPRVEGGGAGGGNGRLSATVVPAHRQTAPHYKKSLPDASDVMGVIRPERFPGAGDCHGARRLQPGHESRRGCSLQPLKDRQVGPDIAVNGGDRRVAAIGDADAKERTCCVAGGRCADLANLAGRGAGSTKATTWRVPAQPYPVWRKGRFR
jgi:hypothetical protein